MRILLALILVVLVAVLAYWFVNSPPQVKLDHELKAVGRATPIKVTIEDRSGLRQFRAWWEQNGKTIPIEQATLSGEKRHEFELTLGAQKQQGLTDGTAKLLMEATDAGWIKKTQRASWDVPVQSRPPQLGVLSGQHYINQGGCEMVVYQVGNTAVSSGVRVGQHFYPGYEVPGAQPGTRFALLAFPYNEPAATVPVVVARDAAGNEAVATFWYKLFPRTWRTRPMDVTDDFLQKVVPPILSRSNEVQNQGDLLKNFLEINGKLRHINNAFIAKQGENTEKRFLWNDAFVQLGNSQVEAQFADHRLYSYHGQKIDEADHLGFDLATVQQAPVEAANRGKVIFADWLGIYGNAIIIDHGFGLQSLYGHLSSFGVKAGDMVEKRQVIARSDSTGLAGGDHLHFSMLLNGGQVNPTEWWDQHWINGRLLVKFPNGHLPGAPVPAIPQPPAPAAQEP